MKKSILSISLVAATAFAGCGGGEESTTKFNAELGAYMTKQIAPIGTVVTDCAPLKNGVTNCNVLIRTRGGNEKATAENVRRTGNKFVWDHES